MRCSSCSRITTATLFATYELDTSPVRQRFGIQTALMRAVAIAILVLHAGLASAQRIPMPLPGGNPVLKPEIDPTLSSLLQSAGLSQLIEAVVTLDHYPTTTDVLAAKSYGVEVRPFHALPMVAVRGISPQIRSLLASRVCGQSMSIADSPTFSIKAFP